MSGPGSVRRGWVMQAGRVPDSPGAAWCWIVRCGNELQVGRVPMRVVMMGAAWSVLVVQERKRVMR